MISEVVDVDQVIVVLVKVNIVYILPGVVKVYTGYVLRLPRILERLVVVVVLVLGVVRVLVTVVVVAVALVVVVVVDK